MRPAVAAVGGAVVVVVVPLLPWLGRRASDPEALAGLCCQLAAVVVGIVLCRQGSDAPARARGSLGLGALLLLLGLVVDVRIVQMGGVLCLVHAATAIVAPGRVRSLLPVLLLLLVGLPLAGDLDVLGFPARFFAARIAQAVLSFGGVDVLGAETVLVVEGNVADVAAPCSGLQTLRMLLVVILILGAVRRAGLLSLLAAVGVAGVVAVAGNALRVTVLAALALGLHRSDLARLAHLPLGVIAFVVATAAADRILQGTAGHPAQRRSEGRRAGVADVVALVLVAVVATLLRLWSPHEVVERRTYVPAADALPLSAAEEALFGSHAWFAEKRPVDGGSALVVVATSLRAHHAPERCLAGNGLRVDASTTRVIVGVPVKRLVLDGGARTGISFFVRDDGGVPLVQATLWERAADQLLRLQRGPWAFVSVVVDPSADVDTLVPALVSSAYARVRLHPEPP